MMADMILKLCHKLLRSTLFFRNSVNSDMFNAKLKLFKMSWLWQLHINQDKNVFLTTWHWYDLITLLIWKLQEINFYCIYKSHVIVSYDFLVDVKLS